MTDQRSASCPHPWMDRGTSEAGDPYLFCRYCGYVSFENPDPPAAIRLEDPLIGANCSLCGSTADNFHVPDDLWERVGLGHVQACFKCFRIAAWHAGVTNGDPWEVHLDSA